MSSPSKKISIVVISYAVPPEAVQLREGFSISFQCSKSFRGCASELGVNSGSWGFVANCFNVRRDAGTLKAFSNLGSDRQVGFSFLEAVSKFCNPFPAMAVS